MSLRNGVPGAVRWRWPITSSRLRGRIRTASGAAARAARSSASSNKLSTEASLLGLATAECAVWLGLSAGAPSGSDGRPELILGVDIYLFFQYIDGMAINPMTGQ